MDEEESAVDDMDDEVLDGILKAGKLPSCPVMLVNSSTAQWKASRLSASSPCRGLRLKVF